MSRNRIPYTPLQTPNEIRILQLQPSNHVTKGALPEAKVIHTAISTGQSFSALSYVWGVEKDEELLSCEGGKIRITKNLGQALRHLQHRHGLSFVWIDALCINQNDVPERNQQVKLMGDIYGTAKEVLIWLGADQAGQAQAIFDTVSLTIDELTEAIESGIEPEDTRSWLPREEAEERLKIVAPLFGCEWFSRTWTIQEAGLTDKPIALWGEASVDFALLGLFCMAYAKYFGPLTHSLGLADEMGRVTDLFTMYLPSPGAKRLHQVLHQGRRYLATDSRDKVYAFMSHPAALERTSDYPHHGLQKEDTEAISEDAIRKRNLAFILSPGHPFENQDTLAARLAVTNLNHSPRPPSPDAYSARRILHWPASKRVHGLARYRPGRTSFITPNYDHSLVTVYRDFAMSMITRFESLEILSFVFHPSDPPLIGPTFPSWAPRWDVPTRHKPLGLATSDHFASANRRPVITPSSDLGVLIARGILFDRVASHTITLKRADFLDPNTTSPVFSLASRSKVDKDPVPDYPRVLTPISGTSDRSRAYQATWTAGALSSSYGDDHDFLAYQAEFLRRRLSGERADKKPTDLVQLVSMVGRGSEKGSAERYGEAAADACDGRRFFITQGALLPERSGPTGVVTPDLSPFTSNTCLAFKYSILIPSRYSPNTGNVRNRPPIRIRRLRREVESLRMKPFQRREVLREHGEVHGEVALVIVLVFGSRSVGFE
ncbi:heterokaryon incompatibility protein-domain-containing protein [Cercophora newfieldiana]|uniref:Heterokaryon incompatibility protein-domain-containing protein n=1 Tax=Cercophora newfieldiana TaxID=92897 RepID=A0AA40D2G2_9PEZI|nr:heterokaryon incompatibility protein-domain-containing protein [Cercophora newfieldiana]